jgi:glycosyltransferase involved in cell wall biosynthesis
MALRLPAPPVPPGHGPPAGPGPVVVFLPAHDEEATVAAVVARVPELVGGRRVECLVVDDGSGDRTAELAAAAGATVLPVATNRGLGAAVRLGLAAAVERGAAAVAFCDADREYDPGELERLVAPILEGRADYVVGSRFAGEIRRMLPQRRLGNLALTALLRFVARAPIGDGQSGFRALSRAAAADAEIVHDYNYAQVLTLDLLAKGYRYLEVPIGYRFRSTGRSFVRPLRYLRRVVPAVWRELDRHHRARGNLGRPPDVEMASRPFTVGLEGADRRASSPSRSSTTPSSVAWSASSAWSPATSTTPRTSSRRP